MDKQPQQNQSSLCGVVYVMGVSGCGKSTVARLIADSLGVPFCEADALHPETNIQKMAAGIPLNDKDREPWLREVKTQAAALASANAGCVVACSSLKRRYRDILRQAHPNTVFVYMRGDFETIFSRMSSRTGHFMPETLLQSQFDALEEPTGEERCVTVSIGPAPAVIAEQALHGLNQFAAQPID